MCALLRIELAARTDRAIHEDLAIGANVSAPALRLVEPWPLAFEALLGLHAYGRGLSGLIHGDRIVLGAPGPNPTFG
jgi:hypothetical protein